LRDKKYEQFWVHFLNYFGYIKIFLDDFAQKPTAKTLKFHEKQLETGKKNSKYAKNVVENLRKMYQFLKKGTFWV